MRMHVSDKRSSEFMPTIHDSRGLTTLLFNLRQTIPREAGGLQH